MKKILLALLLSGCVGGNIHAENDFFNPLQKNSDKYFTHGTRLSYELDNNRTYSAGQNIYTPSKKRSDASFDDLKRDRPYTGWLYGEFRTTIQNSYGDSSVYGIQLGCSGPCSFARQTQSEVHRFLKQHVPTWDRNFSLKSEPGFILEAERRMRLYETQLTNLTAYGLSKFGNIIDNASFGVDLRAGWGLDEALQSGNPIIFKAPALPQNPWVGYTFFRAEQRFVAYNHFLDGSLFQKERHTVDSTPLVQEADLGFSLGYENFIFTYTYTVFSNEWEERNESFAFGGVDFKW